METTIKIGDKIKNIKTGKIEICKNIKNGYINEYREDLWILATEEEFYNYLPEDLLNKICFGRAKWNGKFYGNYIYVSNVKYKINEIQKQELAKFNQTEI